MGSKVFFQFRTRHLFIPQHPGGAQFTSGSMLPNGTKGRKSVSIKLTLHDCNKSSPLDILYCTNVFPARLKHSGRALASLASQAREKKALQN